MSELVSVIVPVYNAQRWLSQTIECLLGQSHPHIEIILIDDGSTDGSYETARKYESQRVKVVRQENAGPSMARNRGLTEAQGDYIQYLDADDLISLDKIALQVEVLRNAPPHTLAICDCRFFFDDDDPQRGILQTGWPAVDSDDPVEWFVGLFDPTDREFGMVPVGCWLTPRSLAVQAGPWGTIPRNPDDDGEYFARVVLRSKALRRSGGMFYYRKLRAGGSWSGRRNSEWQWATLNSLLLKLHYLRQHREDDRVRSAFGKLLLARALEAYPEYRDVSHAALAKARELGVTASPQLTTQKTKMLASIVGWKAARTASVYFNRYLRFASRERVSAAGV